MHMNGWNNEEFNDFLNHNFFEAPCTCGIFYSVGGVHPLQINNKMLCFSVQLNQDYLVLNFSSPYGPLFVGGGPFSTFFLGVIFFGGGAEFFKMRYWKLC